MSNELLNVAFAAMNGDADTAQEEFETYCAVNGIELGQYNVSLEKVAKSVVAFCSGNSNESAIVDIATEFGYEATFPAKNEESTIEEELKSLESQSLN